MEILPPPPPPLHRHSFSPPLSISAPFLIFNETEPNVPVKWKALQQKKAVQDLNVTWLLFGCHKHAHRRPLQIQWNMLELEFSHTETFKSPFITHTHTQFRDLLLVKSSAHLAVRQSCESSFGLGWLEELYDGSESWGWQQHSAQRAVSWEQRLQLWRRHSSWKVFHQDHACAPRRRGLYAQSTRGNKSAERLRNVLLFRQFG